LAYDLKNGIEALQSGNPDLVKFDDLLFFIPGIILILRGSELLVGMEAPGHDAVASAVFNARPDSAGSALNIEIKSRFSRAAYIDTVEKLQQHILRGDCYEINFCQEFYNEDAVIDPLQVYRSLSIESPNPFSCYYKVEDKY